MGIRRVVAMAGLAGALLFAPGTVTANESQFSADEMARLESGQTVAYPQSLTRHGRRYIGGVTYVVVDATAGELASLLDDPTAYVSVLPHAKGAQLVEDAAARPDRLVEITQGTALVEAAYTLRMRTDDEGRRVRFWLDPERPHGIDDAWGFFRTTPLEDAPDGSPRVLLAYGILVDLGPGLVRDFFESRIQASLLTVPERLRQYASVRFRGKGPA
jgi:hypothetical protein